MEQRTSAPRMLKKRTSGHPRCAIPDVLLLVPPSLSPRCSPWEAELRGLRVRFFFIRLSRWGAQKEFQEATGLGVRSCHPDVLPEWFSWPPWVLRWGSGVFVSWWMARTALARDWTQEDCTAHMSTCLYLYLYIYWVTERQKWISRNWLTWCEGWWAWDQQESWPSREALASHHIRGKSPFLLGVWPPFLKVLLIKRGLVHDGRSSVLLIVFWFKC